jgi:hypothetical protein
MDGIKVKPFRGKLYRANKTNANKNIFASINYRDAPRKYFTLHKNELSAYTKEGTSYKKTWDVISDLRLVDILDLETRKNLENYFITNNEKKALKNAFPIKNNKPSRNSFSVRVDNIVLDKLCELDYDGYYMETISAFHSEVGLCNNALKKLKLINSEEVKEAPRLTRKTQRNHWGNSSNNNNNNQQNNNNNNRRTKRRRLSNTPQVRQPSFF